ncbi:hypothetical protein ES703_11645 [subsurface metagenome]
MKTPEDIKHLREISTRLKELGCPVDNLNEWIDKEEQKLDKFLKTANPIERMGIGKQ